MIVSALSAIGFGIGIALILFGATLYHSVFFTDRDYRNSLVPMGLSFGFLATGLALLYQIVV